MVGIALDSRQSKEDVTTFAQGRIQYPVVWDTGSQIASQYRVRGIPTAFIIDKNNTILWKGHPMRLTEQKIEELISRVAQ